MPAVWTQTGITAELVLGGTMELDQPGFMKHLNDMIEEYRKVVWINLLDTRKGHEQ